MSDLRIQRVDSDATRRDWQHVHNTIIPTDVLSIDDVRERAERHRLDVAYLGDVLVGCSTVRPPTSETPAATVIARVLPEHRRRGFGTALYERGLTAARDLEAPAIETIILASNVDGLRFAQVRGFVETDRYVMPGDTVPFVTLRLASTATSPHARRCGRDLEARGSPGEPHRLRHQAARRRRRAQCRRPERSGSRGRLAAPGRRARRQPVTPQRSIRPSGKLCRATTTSTSGGPTRSSTKRWRRTPRSW